MAHNPDLLAAHEIWMLRVGFSYALEALWREIEPGNYAGRFFETEIQTLRTSSRLIQSKQPQCVKDRFAYFTQTIRLSPTQTEQFRSFVFEAQSK
jgi:hypothetical protein